MLDKTKMCKFFMKGECMRGNTCTFAHNQKELHPQPDLYKTQLCSAFIAGGSCRRGNRCKFAHGFKEVRAQKVEHQEPSTIVAILHSAQLQGVRLQLQATSNEVTPPVQGCLAAESSRSRADAWHSASVFKGIPLSRTTTRDSDMFEVAQKESWQCRSDSENSPYSSWSGDRVECEMMITELSSKAGISYGLSEDTIALGRQSNLTLTVQNTFITAELPSSAPIRKVKSTPCLAWQA